MNISLTLGAMADPIHEQLGQPEPEQGSARHHLQRDAEEIARLYVRRLLSETERTKACRRLVKNIQKEYGRTPADEELAEALR